MLARDLSRIDPDDVMTALRAEFDPGIVNAPIQDCFSDGFFYALNLIRDQGCAPISAHRAEMLSGVEMGSGIKDAGAP